MMEACICFQVPISKAWGLSLVPSHVLVWEAAFVFWGILRPFHDHKQIEFLDMLASWQLIMGILSMKYSFLAMTQ